MAPTAARTGASSVDWHRRIFTLLVGVPTALRLLVSDVGMLLLVVLICALCLIEYSDNIWPQIVRQRDATRALSHRVLLVVAGVLPCLAASTGNKDVHDALMALATLAVVLYHLLCTTKADEQAITSLLLDVFALLFIASGLSHAVLLRYTHATYGLGFQILGVVSAWVCDSAALVVGAFCGHTKLAPALSPGKTVVGALAGVAASVATVLLGFTLPMTSDAFADVLPPTPFATQCALGLTIGVLCIVGDLLESFVKRAARVKDSGVLFPGHGGCLDRMDSVLLAAPFLFYYCRFALA